MKDSVELCQRFGRARHEESSIVVLDERPDRPMEMLESVRSLQETIAQQYDPRVANASTDSHDEALKQRSRERNARSVLENERRRIDSPVATLNEFVKKTKAFFEESCSSQPPFVYTMSYSSVLRSIPDIAEQGPNKKEAKRLCAAKMLAALEADMRS